MCHGNPGIPYMQYFLGLHVFQQEPLFDPSMMVHFRKRFPVEEVAKINEYVCTGKWPENGRNVDRNDGIEDLPKDDSDDKKDGGGQLPSDSEATEEKQSDKKSTKGKRILIPGRSGKRRTAANLSWTLPWHRQISNILQTSIF